MQSRIGFARLAWLGGLLLTASLTVLAARIETRLPDFFGPGTQPGQLQVDVFNADSCTYCHSYFNRDTEPFSAWAASLMGQAARDPLFHACLAIAEQDAAFVGDICIRCHVPGGWLEGRSVPTDGSALFGKDFQGVSCHFCHRLVNPDYEPGVSPPDDEDILDPNSLPFPPVNPHSGHFVVDPFDRRRGPYDLGDFFTHAWLESPYHRRSELCGTCHDVSNPAFTRQPDGTYVLNDLQTPHPTHDKYDEFPLERTFSEWLMSDFALGPIDMGGRFGGNQPAVSTCQDCHMPATTGRGCVFGETHTDLPTHYFNGGNTWVLQAVWNLYPDWETYLDPNSIVDSMERTNGMLEAASDLELSRVGDSLNVRVINQTGHKLPTGYPEGRRMWLNVRFFNLPGDLIAERGHYDFDTATLTENDTKVYEAKLGVDAAVSALTGIPLGPSFHFAVNNLYYKDNRIPPRGFTNANFAAVQAGPVAYSYSDGQYWDDTQYPIPPGAVRAEVRLFYQTSSREYIEFLRDENTTNDAGQVAYDQWLATGRSAPVEMDFGELAVGCGGDLDGDSVVGLGDLAIVLAHYGESPADPADGDLDTDGDVDLVDLALLLSVYGTSCN